MLHAFDACGLELEYVLADRTSLDVLPVADAVLQRLAASQTPVNDYEHEGLGWSNELVMHVVSQIGPPDVSPYIQLVGTMEQSLGLPTPAQ